MISEIVLKKKEACYKMQWKWNLYILDWYSYKEKEILN